MRHCVWLFVCALVIAPAAVKADDTKESGGSFSKIISSQGNWIMLHQRMNICSLKI